MLFYKSELDKIKYGEHSFNNINENVVNNSLNNNRISSSLLKSFEENL